MLAFAVPMILAATPADFIADVKPLYDVVTCQGTPLTQLDAKTLAAYCAGQNKRYAHFRSRWAVQATKFVGDLLPPELPEELVYPFGGGDLMAALALFPKAKVITTLSLELAGDPRRLPGLTNAKVLKSSLSAIANASASTLMSNDSLSKNLSATQQGELPGQLSMHLMGLALAGQEPVSVKFFRVEPDGTLHYFSADEVKELEGTTASNLKASWKAPDFSPAFANVEIQFVPRGQPDAPRRTHRHLAANLANDSLPPGVLKHLEAKGRVTAMTKAASYLLWREAFSTVRDYLLSHADFMVSDSTGIPPRHWTTRGCTVAAYGAFEKSFLGTWEPYQEELRKTFATATKLPMRFGYPDGSPGKHNHLLIASCVKPK
ncbi:MAG: hypothetical protein Q8S42_26705 [Archangium sp.]|nr:hypothetical protein [Archangium sp.]